MPWGVSSTTRAFIFYTPKPKTALTLIIFIYETLISIDVMTEKIAVGVRIPQEHLHEIDAICQTTGKSRSQVLLDAVEMYLGKVSNDCVRSELEDVKHRLTVVEKRMLAWMGQS